MNRFRAISIVAVMLGATLSGSPTALSPQGAPALSGEWALNRGASEFPKEIGFTADWIRQGFEPPTAPTGGGRGGGRRGGGGGGGGTGRAAAPRPDMIRESADDAKRVQVLTGEVRNPPAWLSIAQTSGAVTITDDQGQSRTFHPGTGDEVLHLDEVPVPVSATWVADHLVVVYAAEEGHQLRYTYSVTGTPARLRVDVQFVQRGGGDSVVRMYDPAPPGGPHLTTMDAGRAPAGSVPAAPGPAIQAPGNELKGLSRVGVVVEDLDAKAAECGLNRSTIETAASKALSAAGLHVATNSDEDTYVYVNIMTTTMASGFCVSRYDVSLFTHTTATLSYQTKPSLVQVALLHKGGFAGGAAAQHAAGVLQGITQYTEQFAVQIRDANK